MKLSIRTRILLLAGLSICLLVVVGGLLLQRLTGTIRTVGEMDAGNRAVHFSMDLDMMHDAMRADVLNAVLAANQKTVSSALKDVQTHGKRMGLNLEELHQMTLPATVAEAITANIPLVASYITEAHEIVTLAASDVAAAQARLPAFLALFSKLEEALAIPGVRLLADSAAQSEQAAAEGHSARIMLTWSIGISALILAIVAWLVARSIPLPFSVLAARLSEIANEQRAASVAVTEIAGVLAAGSSSQAASVEEVSSGLMQLSSSTMVTVGNADRTAALAVEASGKAERGQAAAQRVAREVADSLSGLTSAIEEIRAANRKTAAIVETIDDIAFQTNLLALNAAVEAARAGDAGAGFAVVADEVRNLAQRSAEEARSTTAVVEASQEATERVTAVARDLTKRIEQAVGGELGGNFTELVDATGDVSRLMRELSQICKEQSNGIGAITDAMRQIDQVTQDNAAKAQGSQESSQSLNRHADELDQAIDDLQVLVRG